MIGALTAGTLDGRLDELLAERTRANAIFFDAEAERIARLCHRMAERFARGARLLALGQTPVARSHASRRRRVRPSGDRGQARPAGLRARPGGRADRCAAVIDDVHASVGMKAAEVGELREQTLTEGRESLVAAADTLRSVFDAGAKLLVAGNGGSATDAMDVVADFRAVARPAIDLTEDGGILTVLANDIGPEALFQRQVIAYGGPGDALLTISTSGGSQNIIAALAEARRRGLRTIALVGYDGGRTAGEGLADHVIVTRSQHIPRIQEAQASVYHVLRELVELPLPGAMQ